MNIGEAPVTEGGDDRWDKLSESEGEQESERGTLHEEEAMRTSDENERLGDDSYLQVDNHMELRIIVVVDGRGSTVRESDAKLVVEPGGTDDNSDKGNTAGHD